MKKFLRFCLFLAFCPIAIAQVDPYQESLKYLNGAGVEVYLSKTIGLNWTGASAPTNAQLIQAQTNLGLPTFASFTPTTNQVLTWNGTIWTPGAGGGGGGGVSSVGLALPAIFTVSGSPVTTTGTLTGALATQTANLIWAGPATGVAAAPTFRLMVAADIPNGIVANASLANSSVTIGSTAVSLGSTVATFAGVTLTSPTFTGPNLGTPASGVATNLTGTAASLTAGNATLAAGLSGTPALPNGTTATTQSVADNTTKIATDAFVLANSGAPPTTTILSGTTPTVTWANKGSFALGLSGNTTITFAGTVDNYGIKVQIYQSTNVTVASITGGTFTLGDAVTQVSSGAKAFVAVTASSGTTLVLDRISGTPTSSAWTDVTTPGATATQSASVVNAYTVTWAAQSGFTLQWPNNNAPIMTNTNAHDDYFFSCTSTGVDGSYVQNYIP